MPVERQCVGAVGGGQHGAGEGQSPLGMLAGTQPCKFIPGEEVRLGCHHLLQHSQLPGNCFTVQFSPPPLLWLMVIFSSSSAVELAVASFVGQRGCPPTWVIHQVSSGRGSSAAVLLLPSPGWRGCSVSSQAGPFTIPHIWGGQKERSGQKRDGSESS